MTDVRCPFCGSIIDLEGDEYVLVDGFNQRFRAFCNWKHLGRWITETYERGDQFKEGLANERRDEGDTY